MQPHLQRTLRVLRCNRCRPDRIDHEGVWRDALVLRSCGRQLLYVIREFQ
jgi:hypothetical protein